MTATADPAATVSLHWTDWTVVAAYAALILGLSVRARLRQTDSADYFLAGRRRSFVVVAISMYATLFSTISFVAIPGEAYQNGILLSLNSVGYCLFTPLAVWLFLRYFYGAGRFTAYEYLERRYSVGVRTLGSIVFLVGRGIYGGTVFYAAARVFEALIGWDATQTILIAGAFTILYTTLGGMGAIMFTDVLQASLVVGGMLILAMKLSMLVGFDYAAVWQHAAANDHGFGRVLHAEFYSLDPYVRYTFWVWLVTAVMNPLSNYGTDQLVVQRLLASRSYDDAKRAVWLKTLAGLPLSLAFWFIGLMLFYYYGVVSPATGPIAADHVVGTFITQHLPSPLPGVIAASLLAALMSTDSTLNSLSTVTCVDLLKRHGLWASEAQQVKAGTVLTVVWGVLVIGLALLLVHAGRGIQTTVLEVSAVCASMWGVLLVVMLAGVLTSWATARAAFHGLLTGIAVNLTLPWWLYYGTPAEQRISFAWVSVPGILATAAVVLGASLMARRTAASPAWAAAVEK